MYGGDASGDDLYIYANSVDANTHIDLVEDILIYGLNHIRMYDNNISFLDFEKSGIESIIRATPNADLSLLAQGNNDCPELLLEQDTNAWVKVSDAYSFYISSCSDEQFFQFSHNGDDSTMYGGDTSLDDLIIRANTVNAWPQFELLGNSHMRFSIAPGADFIFRDASTIAARLEYAANITTFSGGNVSGDDLILKANNADAQPFIQLYGAGNIHLATGTQFVQYGVYKAEVTDTFSGYIEMDDDGGTRRRFMICET
jgi:hypothetical protein